MKKILIVLSFILVGLNSVNAETPINVVKHDKMIHYVSQDGDEHINNATILLEAQAELITFALSGSDAGLFALVNPLTAEKKSSLVVAPQGGFAQVTLSYLGDFNHAIGKTVDVIITAGDNSTTLTTTIEDMPILTFYPAQSDYTIKHTNRTNITYTVDANAATPTTIQITDESMLAVEMSLSSTTSTDGYAFIGWQEISQDADGNDIVKYISYDTKVTYAFRGTAQVRPQFVKYDEATFYIQSQADKKIAYSDFALALKEAEELYKSTKTNQVVIFESVFTIRGYTKPTAVTDALNKEAILAAGDYIIPEGVTVLIPGDAERTVRVGDANVDDFIDDNSFTNVRKLNVSDHTTITINGRLSVYAVMSNKQGFNGQPITYGQIDLGINSHIVANSGAILTVYGYITGDPNNSSVTIQDGATIHETFQIMDWRGGSAIIIGGMLDNDQKVFPVQQYYIQSVETRLILKSGASERLATAVDVTGVGEVVPNAYFIVPDDANYNEGGLFRMGGGITLTKYYDRTTDRLKFIAQGDSPEAEVHLDRIQLTLASYDVDSKDYVLAINNNIDISILNAEAIIPNDVSFLAGSTLYVGPTAKITTNSNVFIYDNDEHAVSVEQKKDSWILGGTLRLAAGKYNYFASTNAFLCPVAKIPSTLHDPRTTPYNRKNDIDNRNVTDNSTTRKYLKDDAKWVIDGVVSGKIFTTAGGANITSNGGGQITITASAAPKLYQAVQYAALVGQGIQYGTIPNTTAKLQMDGGLIAANANTVYYYDKSLGYWTTNATTPIIDNNDYTPNFTLSQVSPLAAKVGASVSTELTAITGNDKVAWADVDWSYRFDGLSAGQFAFAWGIKPAGIITFAPASVGNNKLATLTITASYVKNQILYTYSQKINLIGVAESTANDLAFAISAATTTAQTLFQNGNGAAIDITNADALASAVTLIQSGNNWTIAANENINTTINIHATQVANSGVAAAAITKTIIVGKGRTPLQVPITASAANFANLTWSKSANVAFNHGVSLPANSQWTGFFTGAPDKLKFTPSAPSVLQIEEYDGKNWNIIHPWNTIIAGKEFTITLSPAASKVRIKSATSASTLANLQITALKDVNVTANVDTLFIPIATADNPVSKEVLFTYQAEGLVTIQTSNASTLVVNPKTFDPAVDNYKQQLVTLTSSITEPGEYRMTAMAGGVEKLVIPIIVYNVPQKLPIMLSTDADKYRFYYVTSTTRHTEWNASSRKATLKNMPGVSAPSITFAFDGAPTYISFNNDNISTCKGTWHIEQSADAVHWQDATIATDKHSTNNVEYAITHTSQYIRVTYESLYAEDITLSNIMIIGEPDVIVDPLEMELMKDEPQTLTIIAINLSEAPTITSSEGFTIGASTINGTLAPNGVATITTPITYESESAVKYGTLTISYGDSKTVVVQLTGLAKTLNTATGIYTGVNPINTIAGSFDEYTYQEVDIVNAYVSGQTAFDYLIIYGETKPASGTNITAPTSSAGSNAITPCFIYKAKTDKTGYELHKYDENVNTANKIMLNTTDLIPVENGTMNVYITGFCPYASTGYTKAYEGVWYFQGKAGETLNIYLEDAHIYSRNKTEDGHPFQSKQDGNSFTESYVRGSGAVFVFECDEKNNLNNPFKVNIHTRGNNVLKSNHGCFYDILGYRAYQVSSPIQIHMKDENYVNGSTTELTFDDIWPNTTDRTNGYLALKKQVNNAPSIDMGNTNTVVNFKGGQLHLQNAQIVSENYQTTLAICYRSGKMGGIEFHFAHGIGTDDVGGTVNFYDGTTTVEQMTVDAKYRQYYLMDLDENGNELSTTSCLRLPKNTYVYGGSHCMMRACQHTTSKGGAPTDGTNPLGLYQYPKTSVDGKKAGWIDGKNGLVIPTASNVPTGYNVESVTPNTNGTDIDTDDYLNFWVTSEYDSSVNPEIDMETSYWEACMTKISAELGGQGGSVGGELLIDENTEVQNLLYCKVDKEIYDAITALDYQAPVKVPSTTEYQRIPISVEASDIEGAQVLQNYITNTNSYTIQGKVYYVTTATADMWMTFTPPFDVENIYVIESYSEQKLSEVQPEEGSQLTQRQAVMQEQAKHNADFAAFYGVAMALYKNAPIGFWDIYNDFITWAKQEDKYLYSGTYDLRGYYPLTHYDGTNYATANYYLYEGTANWTLSGNDDGKFETNWEVPNTNDGVLMNQGTTYSMLFPYCTGCGVGEDINDREYWDYWSGKFILFESTDGPHTIQGANFVADEKPAEGDWLYEPASKLSPTEAIVTGNSTFSMMQTEKSDVYVYDATMISGETFYRNVYYDEETGDEATQSSIIYPTTAFLLANPPANAQSMPARGVKRTGEIIYDDPNNGGNGNTSNLGNIPTINGGSDIFVTEVVNGINIAVATPQYVRVLSSSGAMLYSGMVESAVDVNLPNNGIYVVAGENTSLKIMY